MVSYAARLKRHAGGKHMTRGAVPFPMMRRSGGMGGGDLMAAYAQRKLRRARERQTIRSQQRPDDQEAQAPDAMGAQPGEEGENEAQISGARLEEMLKLAGAGEAA